SVTHHEVSEPEDIGAATHALIDAGSELIAVNGGDGTVQAGLTALFSPGALDALPLLAGGPGGTANMVAADVGPRLGPGAARRPPLGAVQDCGLRGTAVWRPVMRAEITPDAAPIYSMFFGTGAIYHGIKFCRQYVARLGLRGEIGPGIALAVFISKIATGH